MVATPPPSTSPTGPPAPPSSASSSSIHHKSCHASQHKKTTHNNKEQQQHQERYSSKEVKSTCKNGCIGTTQHTTTAEGINLKCISGHFNDNDGIIAALLNAFQFQAKDNSNNNNSSSDSQPTDIHNHIMSIDATTKGTLVSGGLSGHCSLCHVHPQHNVYVNQACYSIAALPCCSCSTSYCCGNSNSNSNCNSNNLLFISPKLLLNKLRLCHYNKYWLVQNKYAEMISNLSYATLRSYYGNNYTINSNNHRNCCCSCASLCSADGCQMCCCGNDDNGMNGLWHEDDMDGTDYVCSLEVSIIFYFQCLYFIIIFLLSYTFFYKVLVFSQSLLKIVRIFKFVLKSF